MSRSEDEKLRIRNQIERLRSTIDAAEIALRYPSYPPRRDTVQSLQLTSSDLAMSLVRLEAFATVEAWVNRMRG